MCMSHIIHIWHDVLCAIYSRRTHTDVCARDVTHRHVSCASFVCVARRVHMCDVPHACVSSYVQSNLDANTLTCVCGVTHCYVSCALFVTQSHTNIHQHTTWPILMRCDWLISTRCDRILRHAITNQTHTHTHTHTRNTVRVFGRLVVSHISTHTNGVRTQTHTHTHKHTHSFIHQRCDQPLARTLHTLRFCDRIIMSQDYHVSGLSCLTCESVMSHIWKSHVTQILLLKSLKVSCPTHESVMSHKYRCYSCWWFFISYCARNIAKSHITHWLNVSCHTYESGISCIWMRLVSHLWMKSRHTHTRGIVVNSFMSHIYMSHVTHILLLKLLMGSRLPHKWVMSHKYRSYSRWWCAISCRARHRAESHKAHEQVVFHIRSRHVAHIKWSCRA